MELAEFRNPRGIPDVVPREDYVFPSEGRHRFERFVWDGLAALSKNLDGASEATVSRVVADYLQQHAIAMTA